jgi:hypothetical protein
VIDAIVAERRLREGWRGTQAESTDAKRGDGMPPGQMTLLLGK